MENNVRGGNTMREQLEKRLKELAAEFEAGQKMVAELEARQANLRNTLVRISGAIQVLQEELGKQEEASGNGSRPRDTELSQALSG
jgi:predicted nuclease with TOPRIM domain